MFKKIITILSCILSLTDFCYSKALIITHAYNKPEFIEIQCLTFRKYLLDEYEFIVFNDAPEGPNQDAIEQVCRTCGISCIRVPQEIHNTTWLSERHCQTIKYSLDAIGYDHDGIVAFFDSDLFLVRPLSIESLMSGFDIVSAYRLGIWGQGTHLKYLWPGLCLLRMNALPNKRSLNFDSGFIDGYAVDSGGYTYHYLQDNKINIKFLEEFPFRFHHEEIGCNEMEQMVINTGAEFAFDRHFFHIGAASYVDSPIKFEAAKKFISSVLSK